MTLVWKPGLLLKNGMVITGREAGPADPYIGNVSLLLHGDGANGSTTIVDSSPSPKTVTAFGDAALATPPSYPNSNSTFGNAIAFDGNGDYLSIPHSTDLSFGAGNFTVEMWLYANNLAAEPAIFVHRPAVAARGILSAIDANGSIILLAGDSNDSSWEIITTSAAGIITTGAWHHLAITRNGSTWRGWLNGTAVLTPGAASFTLDDSGGAFLIGKSDAGSVNYFNGYIDDFRVTKGIARYTSNFTPPTAPFPDI